MAMADAAGTCEGRSKPGSREGQRRDFRHGRIRGELRCEHRSLLLKRTKINIGKVPPGGVEVAFEMKTPQGIGACRRLRSSTPKE